MEVLTININEGDNTERASVARSVLFPPPSDCLRRKAASFREWRKSMHGSSRKPLTTSYLSNVISL